MFSQGKVSTTFIAVLVIGAIIVILNTTGYLNNASNLSSIILFTAFAVAFALFYDLDQKTPILVKSPTFEEKIVG